MQALLKLQQSFAADLWDEKLNRLDAVIMDGRLPAERLFQVYQNNFWTSAEDALADIYQVVKRLVGDQFFQFMIDHFLRGYPPRYGNMHQLGGDLPVFLSDFKPVMELPYLADIARLELAYQQVFHSANVTPFDPQTLQKIPAQNIPQLCFKMSSSSQLVYSSFPIFQIWSVNQQNYDGHQQVSLDSGSESVLITRPCLEVKLFKLNQTDARFLQSLVAGSNLGQATEAAVKISAQFDLQTTLARYLTGGILIVAGTGPSDNSINHNPTGDIKSC